MSRPLTHRPFAELAPPKPEVTVIRRRTTDPESGLSLVRQIRATPLPTDPPPNARLTPDPSEPDPVAKKKRSPESIAKQKATLAKKRRSKKRAPAASAEDREVAIARVSALIGAGETRLKAIKKVGKELGYSPGALNKWIVEGGKRERAPRSTRVVTSTASSQGIEALLESMVRRIVASELKRVLSQGIE